MAANDSNNTDTLPDIKDIANTAIDQVKAGVLDTPAGNTFVKKQMPTLMHRLGENIGHFAGWTARFLDTIFGKIVGIIVLIIVCLAVLCYIYKKFTISPLGKILGYCGKILGKAISFIRQGLRPSDPASP